MNPDLVQVAPRPESPSDSNLRKIAELLGLSVVCVPGVAEALSATEGQAENGSTTAFMVNAAVLSPTDLRPNAFAIEALRKRGRWLVYGFNENGGRPDAWIRYFGSPLPDTVAKRSQARILRFGPGVPFLAGREYRAAGASQNTVFASSVRAPLRTWVTLDGDPIVISTPHGNDSAHDYFLSAAAGDVGAVLAPPDQARRHFGGILPAAVALRAMCGERCWFNPFPTGCVVIDDPMIRRRYGWFNYKQVLSELKTQNYSATVAFIPCNFRRSDRALAAALASHAERFSICVHGCYHTEGEFGETKPGTLESRAGLALQFMERHTQLTHLPFDRTMVFPQGVFSTAAIRALDACGYMAAVNTEPYPTDHENAPITVGDTLGLAIQRHSDLPLFTRRYPRESFDFAVDLFFGKPVFIVEHHGYFRNGMNPLSRFVHEIKAINAHSASNPIAWKPLQKAVTASGRYRVLGPDRLEVQFATAEFHLQNPRASQTRFECYRAEAFAENVDSVTVDGNPCEFSVGDNRLRLDIVLGPGESRVIRVNRRPTHPTIGSPAPSFVCKAVLRRRLSEFRDNYVDRFR